MLLLIKTILKASLKTFRVSLVNVTTSKKVIKIRIAEIFAGKKTLPHIIGESMCCLKAFARSLSLPSLLILPYFFVYYWAAEAMSAS